MKFKLQTKKRQKLCRELGWNLDKSWSKSQNINKWIKDLMVKNKINKWNKTVKITKSI